MNKKFIDRTEKERGLPEKTLSTKKNRTFSLQKNEGIQYEWNPPVQKEMESPLKKEGHSPGLQPTNLPIQKEKKLNECKVSVKKEMHPPIQKKSKPPFKKKIPMKIQKESKPPYKKEIPLQVQKESKPPFKKKMQLSGPKESNLRGPKESNLAVPKKSNASVEKTLLPLLTNKAKPQALSLSKKKSFSSSEKKAPSKEGSILSQKSNVPLEKKKGSCILIKSHRAKKEASDNEKKSKNLGQPPKDGFLKENKKELSIETKEKGFALLSPNALEMNYPRKKKKGMFFIKKKKSYGFQGKTIVVEQSFQFPKKPRSGNTPRMGLFQERAQEFSSRPLFSKKIPSRVLKEKAFLKKKEIGFQIENLYPFFFRDGAYEKGKKILLEATKFVLDKNIQKSSESIYRENKPSPFKK